MTNPEQRSDGIAENPSPTGSEEGIVQSDQISALERQAREEKELSFFGELRLFLRQNKKWWLMPILIVLILFSVLVILAGTGAAPFIYTLH